jgi:hypothetical protein
MPYQDPTWQDVRNQLSDFRTRHLDPLATELGNRYTGLQTQLTEYRRDYLTARPGWDKDAEILGARGALATYVSDTVRNTTESIITTTRVFADKESNPQEQAAAVLRCFSSFSMMLGLAGPEGLVLGTAVSAVLGIITMILDATNPARESQTQKLEKLLRDLRADDASIEAKAARGMIKQQLNTVRTFDDASQTWEGINHTADVTKGVSQYMLAKTAYWLSIPQNQGLDQWEEVFLSYAETEIQVIDLMNTMLAKLQPRHRTQMVSVLQTYGEELESRFEELMDPVDACGDLWHTTAKWHYGSHAKQLPRKKQYGWEDMNIGSIQSISITSRNGRIWTARWDGNHELMTGQAGQMHSFNNLNGCIDVCLVPFAEKGADLLLVTAAGRNPNTGTALWVNEWHESRGRFHTTDELESDSKKGFEAGWWEPEILGAGGVLMARVFRYATRHEQFVYLVRREIAPDGRHTYSLSHAPLERLQRGYTYKVDPHPIALPPNFESDLPFRITVSKRYLYLFNRRRVMRERHDALIIGHGSWEEVQLPSDRMTDPDGGLWHENDLIWGSNGLNDLYAWSDDHVVGVLNDYALWSGRFDAADRRNWKEFYLEYTSVPDATQLPQGGRSLIVVAWVGGTGGALHFRVFDPDGNRIVDTDEKKLTDRPELQALKMQLKSIAAGQPQKWPKDLTGNQQSAIITGVREVVGAAWRWEMVEGARGATFTKQKHTSFDYCRLLHQAGANLRVGRTEFLKAVGA